MKEYLMLVRENLSEIGKMTPEEMQKEMVKHVKWVEGIVKSGNFKSASPLHMKGKHIKNKITTDGPYIELKEGISGFYFLLANSLEEATEIAGGCPSVETGATIEIREVAKTSQ